MTRVIVVSDTHGNSEGIDNIFNNYKFDYFIFLGDCIKDLGAHISDSRVHYVRGNCDFFSNAKVQDFISINNYVVFFTHGHIYGVKSGIGAIKKEGAKLGANIILYGHTHKYNYENIENLHIINCGALSKVRGGNKSFVILDFDNKSFSHQKVVF